MKKYLFIKDTYGNYIMCDTIEAFDNYLKDKGENYR